MFVQRTTGVVVVCFGELFLFTGMIVFLLRTMESLFFFIDIDLDYLKHDHMMI